MSQYGAAARSWYGTRVSIARYGPVYTSRACASGARTRYSRSTPSSPLNSALARTSALDLVRVPPAQPRPFRVAPRAVRAVLLLQDRARSARTQDGQMTSSTSAARGSASSARYTYEWLPVPRSAWPTDGGAPPGCGRARGGAGRRRRRGARTARARRGGSRGGRGVRARGGGVREEGGADGEPGEVAGGELRGVARGAGGVCGRGGERVGVRGGCCVVRRWRGRRREAVGRGRAR
ncbi:hypothetical protein BJ912DRAFT_240486 [Pholiota molesta]|nr:hypothetical protein BJ912DRAFT_240486 [Pholiota molesta]